MAAQSGAVTLRRRRLVGAGAALPAAAGLLGAACGGSDRGDGGTAAVPGGPVAISFMTDWSAGPRLKVIEDAAALWRERHPNVAVEVRHGGYVQEKLLAELAAGTQADVTLYGTGGVAALRPHFVDLMPFIKRDRFDLREWVLVAPELLHEGGQYGMPFQYNMEAWLYNKTLLEREGVAPPTERWTWADAAAAAQKLTRRDRQQWGLEIAEHARIGQFLFRDMLWANGGDFLSQDLKRTTLNTPQAAEAARWIVDRLHRDKAVIDLDERKAVVPSGLSFAFQTGRVGLFHVNVGWVGFLAASIGFDQFEWDLAWTPRAPRTGKAAYRVGAQPHAVTRSDRRSAAQTDAAWAWTAFLSGPDVMALIAEGRGSIPVHRRVLSGERFLRRPPAGMPNVPKMVDQSRFDVPWFAAMADWRGAINARLNEAFEGKTGVDDALRAAAAEGDAVLARAGTGR
jgi:multiple sugar transport system substrate-binding protein